MPLLCFEARYQIIYGLALLVVSVPSLQSGHLLCVKEKPFMRAAEVLRARGAALGMELARSIKEFLRRLRVAGYDRTEAIKAFQQVFPDDCPVLELELSW